MQCPRCVSSDFNGICNECGFPVTVKCRIRLKARMFIADIQY